MALIAELKRRNVIRMAGLYLVGAWLITQVAGTILPMFDAPAWVPRTVVVVLAIGFIPAIIFAWIFELTPDGLKRDADVAPESSIAPQTARRMERMILALAIVAVLLFAVDKFVLAPARNAALVADTTKTLEQQAATQDKAANEKSIAVLAFTDLSPGHDQEYFSDGIAEEILNSLVRIKDLKVAGRTSSFFYKGKNEDLRTIGKALGVAHVLEGSVRKQGERVRITAQLIRSQDGIHLWSETYDGDMKDVFQLQENIARAITEKLQVILQGDQKTRLVQAGTTNTEAYGLYLQASSIFNRRTGPRFAEAIDLLEKAIALDPAYARAHSRLAALYVIKGNYSSGTAYSDGSAKVDEHARLAIKLDPTLAEPYAAMSLALNEHRQFLKSREAMAQALQLDPSDVTANFWNATELVETGYLRQGNAALDRTLELDPMLPNGLLWRGSGYVYDGDLDNAETMLRKAEAVGHAFAGLGLSRLLAARGDKTAATRELAKGFAGYFAADFPPEAPLLFARAIYGDTVATTQAHAMIDRYLANKPAVIPGIVPYVLFHTGQVGRGLAVMQDQPTSNDALAMSEMFRKDSVVTRAPQFPEFVRRTGLAELWDSVGPPDTCSKDGKGDYYCR